jgi:transcriptional regulator with XRE-family HTH domain
MLSPACSWSQPGAGSRSDRLVSALEVDRGGTRVSEGDPENWAAVARAISDRVRELGWRQRELADRSRVSVAVVREIQRHTVERRRSPRTLQALSVALGWQPEHLDRVLKGDASGGHTVPDRAALWSRLDSLESRLSEISELLTELRSDIARGD